MRLEQKTTGMKRAWKKMVLKQKLLTLEAREWSRCGWCFSLTDILTFLETDAIGHVTRIQTSHFCRVPARQHFGGKAWRNSFIANFVSATERVTKRQYTCLREQQGKCILPFLSRRTLSHHPINRTRREGRREAPDSRTDTEQLSNKNFKTPFPFCWQPELTQSAPFPIGRLYAGTSLTDDVIREFRTGIRRSLFCFWQLKALATRCKDRNGSKLESKREKKRTKTQL